MARRETSPAKFFIGSPAEIADDLSRKNAPRAYRPFKQLMRLQILSNATTALAVTLLSQTGHDGRAIPERPLVDEQSLRIGIEFERRGEVVRLGFGRVGGDIQE